MHDSVSSSAIAGSACLVWISPRPEARRTTSGPRTGCGSIVRYYIATAALSYGIIKLFVLQMPFPTLSQLATPLGDLLPMRFSWLFIGYSAPYQFFSGAMETVAGLLLLYRRTVTAGLFAAMGAFLNVVMINLAYDVPVKLFASHLLFACLFLLALDSQATDRVPRPESRSAGDHGVRSDFARPWQRWGSIAREGVHRLPDPRAAAASRAGRGTRRSKRPPTPGPFAAGRVRRAAATSSTATPFRCEHRHAAVAGRHLRQRRRGEREHARSGVLAALPSRLLPLPAGHEHATVAVWKISTIPRRQHVPLHDALRSAGLDTHPVSYGDPWRLGSRGARAHAAPLPVDGAAVPLALGVQPVAARLTFVILIEARDQRRAPSALSS